MSENLDEILRQAEVGDAVRQADLAYYPPDPARLHAMIDDMSEDQLSLARWLLSVVISQTTMVPSEDPRISEMMPGLLDRPLHHRWESMLSHIISTAPPSWSDTPWRKAWLMMVVVDTVRRYFTIPASWDGHGRPPMPPEG